VPLDHLVERRRLDAEQLRRALLHPAGRLERGLDQALLEIGDHFLEGDALRRNGDLRHLEAPAAAHVVRHEIHVDPRPRTEHGGALDDVLELADVARPVVLEEQVERVGRQLEVRLLVLAAVLVEEVLHEERDVVLALASAGSCTVITCSR
jgi:hypothetical protein